VYTPRGFGVSELGDIEVVVVREEFHLFHLTLPNHDVVQHAVSQDGLSWSPLPAALRTGDPGAIDDDQIWTMSVTPRPGCDGYQMLYTALATADDGRIQRVATATSDDLLHWTKSTAASVISADPRWYESDPAATGAVSWRDPKPVRVGDGYLATICARETLGPVPRRGCAGLLVSHDLEHWETRPPLFAPRRYWDLECPQAFRLGAQPDPDRWYLTAAIMEDRSQRYWFSEQATGPYRVPPGGDLLAPAGHYAARIAHWRDMDLLFAWHQPKLHEGWMTSSRTIDWVEARNPFGKFLAPPLRISARDDGSLALASFPGWDAYRGAGWQSPQSRERTLFQDRAMPLGRDWHIDAGGGMDVLLATYAKTDFIVEGSLVLAGPRGGLALRLNDDGCGLFIELTPESGQIALQRWGLTRNERNGGLRYAYNILQSSHRSTPIDTGNPVPFRLLSVGPYVEASFGGEVAIATMTGSPEAGAWGVWVEDGACSVSDLRWAPMRRPGSVGQLEMNPSVEVVTVG
jgi:beta-fructofuranosidase